MSFTSALQRSKIARGLWHLVPFAVRDAVWKTTYRVLAELRAPIFGATSVRQWQREVMNRDVETLFQSLGPRGLSVVEVSGMIRSGYPWASYRRLEYPEFDLCDPSPTHDGRYDLVICEQVLEHVENPVTAVGNLKALCAPGGLLLVSTPFLIRIHPDPGDFWRFTPDGLKKLLECQGLRVEWVRSWGNRAVVRGNFRVWAPYWPGRNLKNDPDLAVQVWALARMGDVSEA